MWTGKISSFLYNDSGFWSYTIVAEIEILLAGDLDTYGDVDAVS